MIGRWSVTVLSVILALATPRAQGQLYGIGSAKDCLPVEGEKNFLCAGTLVPVVLTDTISSRDGQAGSAALVVVSDVRVGGQVVIAKGSVVKASVDAQSNGWNQQPGIVDVHAVAVSLVTGQTAQLEGAELSVGATNDDPCRGHACVMKSWWMHGENTALKAGTMWSVWVKTTLQLDSVALTKFNDLRQATADPTARVYLYTLGASAAFAADGKAVAHYGPHQYGCVSLNPGAHVLRFGRVDLQVDVESDHDYFLRIETDNSPVAVQLTDTIEIGSESLTPAHPKKGVSIDCLF